MDELKNERLTKLKDLHALRGVEPEMRIRRHQICSINFP
jgi:hypothetical protein